MVVKENEYVLMDFYRLAFFIHNEWVDPETTFWPAGTQVDDNGNYTSTYLHEQTKIDYHSEPK